MMACRMREGLGTRSADTRLPAFTRRIYARKRTRRPPQRRPASRLALLASYRLRKRKRKGSISSPKRKKGEQKRGKIESRTKPLKGGRKGRYEVQAIAGPVA